MTRLFALSLCFLSTSILAQTPPEAGSASPRRQSANPSPADAGTAARWNQWRGPMRTGTFQGPEWPKNLNKSTLKRQWRIEAGPSYSGPVTTGDLVFTTATENQEVEVVRALDRRTGKVVWKHEWEGAMKVPFFANRNGSWIRSTPATDGTSLFVAGMRDRLVCMDAKTGAERWNIDLKERFKARQEAFGFVCSPMLIGPHLYVQCCAGLVKLDKATGDTVWRSMKDSGNMMTGGAFSSPILAEVAGREQLLVQSRTALHGVDPAAGKVLWKMPVKTFRGMNILTPIAFEDGVFTSAYGGRGHFFKLAQAENDAMQATEAWTSRAQAYMSSPVIIDKHAYLYLRSKRFCCVDMETGKLAWTSPPIGDEYWSLVARGNRILALTNGGELYLIDATPEGFKVVDRMEVSSSETWAHLAVDGDQIFIREQDGLSAFRWASSQG